MELKQHLENWVRELNYLNPIEETKNMIDSQAIKNMCLHTSIDARIWRIYFIMSIEYKVHKQYWRIKTKETLLILYCYSTSIWEEIQTITKGAAREIIIHIENHA